MSYTITVLPSNHKFTVEDGENLLQGALRNGLPFPYGCRDGACGTCKGKVISGRIDRGQFSSRALAAAEIDNGMALFCQCQVHSDLVVEVKEVGAIAGVPIRRMPAKVESISRANHDVMWVKLRLPANQRLQFLAGQYIDFLLKNGERRSYSIANSPHDDEFIELHIRKINAGTFSDYVFNELQEKAILRIEGPHGSFFLRADSPRPMIMMAGGTGFAPVKSLLEEAFYRGIERPVYFYWGVRNRRDFYSDLPVHWAQTHSNVHFIPVLSDPLPEDHWEGRIGLVHEAILEDFQDLSNYDVYACGSPAMVYAGRDAFITQGLVEENCFSDAFEFQHPVTAKEEDKA